MATGVVIHARPAGRANLHETRLNREQLIEAIACGRPVCYGLGGNDLE